MNKQDKVELGNGPTSAFTKYKVKPDTEAVAVLPAIKNMRKDAFRKIKLMFGLSESRSTSQKK